MTRLARLQANIAGYTAGQTIDLDEIEDPRVHAAIEAGYGERVVLADLDSDEAARARAEAEDAAKAAEAQDAPETPEKPARGSTPRKRSSGS